MYILYINMLIIMCSSHFIGMLIYNFSNLLDIVDTDNQEASADHMTFHDQRTLKIA